MSLALGVGLAAPALGAGTGAGNGGAGQDNAAAAGAAQAALLDQARMWSSRDRDYMVREVLNKLFRVAPDHPDGLALLARVQARAGQIGEAEGTLRRLRERHPAHPDVARLAALIRLKSADRERLAQARRLAKTGRIEEALQAFRALGADIAPDNDLALEYWQLVAAAPNGWEPARAGLSRLSREHPDNRRIRLALAEHLTARPPLDRAALKTIIELSRDASLSRQARAAWRRVVLRLDPAAESLPLFKDYLAQEPNDSLVREKMESVARTVEARRRLLADPRYRAKLDGLALLDGGKLDEAEERLRQAIEGRPGDAETVGAIGVLRMRQGRHEEAETHFAQAVRLDPAQRARWMNMLNIARYWGVLRRAGEAREAREFERAETLLREARAIDPREPNALLSLARLHADRGRIADAEQAYRGALALAPANADGWSGLIGLHLRAGRAAEADAMLAALQPALRKTVDQALNPLRASLLRDRADLLAGEGKPDAAIAVLEEAIAIDPDDPWSRHDLARLYVRRHGAAEGAKRGQALFDALLLRRPRDPAAQYAQALFQAGAERESEALLSLEQIAPPERSAGMTALQRRLWVTLQGRRAAMLAAAGLNAAAARMLAEAQTALGADPDLLLELAAAWLDIGEQEAARRLLADLPPQPGPQALDRQLRRARLLDRMRADAELAAELDRLAVAGGREGEGNGQGAIPTAQQRETLAELRLSLSLRQADAASRAGRHADALRLLQDYGRPSDPAQAGRLLHAEAAVLRAAGRPAEAAHSYARLLQAVPDDSAAALGLIETQVAAGRKEEALELIRRQLESPRARGADFSAALANALIELGDHAGARRTAESALETAPAHPRLLALAGQLARRDGRTGQAIDFLQRSLAAEAQRRPAEEASALSAVRRVVSSGVPEESRLTTELAARAPREPERAYRQLAELLDQHNGWVSSALDWRSRAGSAGTSRYDAKEFTLEWRPGGDGDRRRFYRVDAVRIDSGMLDLADVGDAERFGAMLLCQGACGFDLRRQRAHGVALGAGYQDETTRVDIGTTPLGFRVRRLVGGVLHKGDLGPFSYSVDLSRRPLTGSLLSYAGTRDPHTGRIWGGVTATGLRLGLSKDEGGSFGAWSSLGLHRISGKNVLANDRLQLMAGGYWRAINEQDRLFTVGATAMLWRHRENAGEYSFGHGGYYSPHSFKSFSLPLTYGQRGVRFSFTLRGAFALSWSRTGAAPYYPTDAGLQSQAEALAAAGGTDPHYAAGSSTRSPSRSFAAAWEYQWGPALFIGGRMEVDRSADYTPNRFLLYLRYAVDRHAARPVLFPPEPVVPSSQY